MTSATFKQFSAALDAHQNGLDLPAGSEHLHEIFWKSDEDRAAELLKKARNGDEKATGDLEKLLDTAEQKKKMTAVMTATKKELERVKARLAASKSAKKNTGTYKWDVEGSRK